MHPIERLRYVARASGGDQRTLVRETAGALRGLQLEPAGLVVACRRIIERHPTSGPLWWLCASLLTSPEPFAHAWGLADAMEDDPTPQSVYDAVADEAVVCVLGWPDLAGEALGRRGDVRVLAVDVDNDASSFVRRLQRNEVEAELVSPPGVSAAVMASDVVVIEAHACGPDGVLAVMGSQAAAAVAYCAEVPVWLVAGRGRRLPDGLWQAMVAKLGVDGEPWEQAVETVPLQLLTAVIGPDGVMPALPESLAAECPMAPELLRSSPM